MCPVGDAAAGGNRSSKAFGGLEGNYPSARQDTATLPLLPRISSSSPFVVGDSARAGSYAREHTATLVPRMSSSSPIIIREVGSVKALYRDVPV